MEYLPSFDLFTVSSYLIFIGAIFAFLGGFLMELVARSESVSDRLFNFGSIIMYLSNLTFASSVIIHATDGLETVYAIIVFALCSFCIPATGFLFSKNTDYGITISKKIS
jgi:hypothetical protein